MHIDDMISYISRKFGQGERQVSDWVGLNLICPVPPSAAWADVKLAEVAEQVGKMGNIPNQRQPNPVANLTLPPVQHTR